MVLEKLKSNLITILTISMIVSGGFLYTANNLNAEEKKNPTIYICYCAGGCLCAY